MPGRKVFVNVRNCRKHADSTTLADCERVSGAEERFSPVFSAQRSTVGVRGLRVVRLWRVKPGRRPNFLLRQENATKQKPASLSPCLTQLCCVLTVQRIFHDSNGALVLVSSGVRLWALKSRRPRIEVNFFSKSYGNAENGFTARSCFQNAPFSFSVDVGSSSTGDRPLDTPLWEMLGDEKAGRELGGSQGVLPPSREPPVGGSLGASRELGDGPCMAHHRCDKQGVGSVQHCNRTCDQRNVGENQGGVDDAIEVHGECAVPSWVVITSGIRSSGCHQGVIRVPRGVIRQGLMTRVIRAARRTPAEGSPACGPKSLAKPSRARSNCPVAIVVRCDRPRLDHQLDAQGDQWLFEHCAVGAGGDGRLGF